MFAVESAVDGFEDGAYECVFVERRGEGSAGFVQGLHSLGRFLGLGEESGAFQRQGDLFAYCFDEGDFVGRPFARLFGLLDA